MNDFSPFPIKDWYALGKALLLNWGFLVAAVWFCAQVFSEQSERFRSRLARC